MTKTIATENAPAAIGPYVQGVDLRSILYRAQSHLPGAFLRRSGASAKRCED